MQEASTFAGTKSLSQSVAMFGHRVPKHELICATLMDINAKSLSRVKAILPRYIYVRIMNYRSKVG
jgi:hypothetical protein